MLEKMAKSLTCIENASMKPQVILELGEIVGVDENGTIKMFNLDKDVQDSYTVLFFFSLASDSSEVRNFTSYASTPPSFQN